MEWIIGVGVVCIDVVVIVVVFCYFIEVVYQVVLKIIQGWRGIVYGIVELVGVGQVVQVIWMEQILVGQLEVVG